LITVSAADPLNLAGILTPGPRIPAITSNRLLLVDGAWVAALQAGQVQRLDGGAAVPEPAINQALKMGKLPTALRPYYA
jgi:ATP-dependent Lhr-like helicase